MAKKKNVRDTEIEVLNYNKALQSLYVAVNYTGHETTRIAGNGLKIKFVFIIPDYQITHN